MPPSSACTSARTMIITPPISQEMMAAGPAAIRPFCAPNSQPDPMIDPIEAQVSPTRPISRLSEVVCLEGGRDADVFTDMKRDLQNDRRPGPDGQTLQT